MPTIKPRFSITVNTETYKLIEDHQFRGRFKSQTQAVLDLIDKGIEGFIEDGVIPRPQTESPLVEKYNALDEHGKRIVDFVLDEEHARVQSAKSPKGKAAEADRLLVDKIVYTFPAAAGIPLFADDDFEHMEFPADEVPKGADFGVRIQGDSMEPTIADGTIVWVRKASEVQVGRIGIFMIDDAAVCKRFNIDKDGIRLESDNDAYDPIVIDEFVRFGVVGRVLEYR